MIRAAAYCRVSTDQLDQLHSFESQKLFFAGYIESRPDWVLAGLYADEGISGTTTAGRAGFLRMLDDAQAGKFDVILTKEVSRFSRNILDAVATTRALKRIGVAVVFLNDGISTFDPDAELRLGIMASVAQEESRKTSERVKWGQQRKMERGVVFGRSLLGYTVHGGTITVEPKGAELVRLIYMMYLHEGLGVRSIAAELTRRGVSKPLGGKNWSASGILKVLRNEKYCGDLLQRKTITTDFLTHKKSRNRGAVECISIRDHHEAVIPRSDWDDVQTVLNRRSPRGGSASHGSRYTLSGRIICSGCHAVFLCRTRRRKDGSSYRVWVRGACGCTTHHHQVTEASLEGCIRRFFAVLDQKALLYGFDAVLDRIVHHRQGELETVKQNALRLRKKSVKLTEAYLDGIVSLDSYRDLNSRYEEELHAQQELLDTLTSAEYERHRQAVAVLLSDAAAGRAEVGALYLSLVDRAEIQPDGSMMITLHGLSETLRASYK